MSDDDREGPPEDWSTAALAQNAMMLRDGIRRREERLDTLLDVLAARAHGSHDHGPCPDCGGSVDAQVEGAFRDWVCGDCGRVVGGGQLVDEDNDE